MPDLKNTPTLKYRFHEVAGLRLTGGNPQANHFFKSEFAYHSVSDNFNLNNIPLIDMGFKIGLKRPTGYDHFVHKLVARWSYRMEVSPQHIDLSVVANRISLPLIQHFMLYPALRYISAHHGTLMLHAGAVARHGKSLIFIGKRDAGKTFITSLLLSLGRGFELHADDQVFLQGTGSSLALQSRVHLKNRYLSSIQELSRQLTQSELIKLGIFESIHRITYGRINLPVRISPQRIWPDHATAKQATPAAIIFLNTDDNSMGMFPIDNKMQMLDIVIERSLFDARRFINMTRKSDLEKGKLITEWLDMERELLRRVMSQTPLYALNLPDGKVPDALVNTIIPLLEELTPS